MSNDTSKKQSESSAKLRAEFTRLRFTRASLIEEYLHGEENQKETLNVVIKIVNSKLDSLLEKIKEEERLAS